MQPSELLTDRAIHCASELLDAEAESLVIRPVRGGFSYNRRAIVLSDARQLFVKEVDIDLLPDDGQLSIAWLRKEYEMVKVIQRLKPELVAEWIWLSDDEQVLVMSSYPEEEGWIWKPPIGPEVVDYINSVLYITRDIEGMRFDEVEVRQLRLEPHLQLKLSRDDYLRRVVYDPELRRRLRDNYQSLLGGGTGWARGRYEKMIELLGSVSRLRAFLERVEGLPVQSEECFNHCDLRSDNLAFNVRTGVIKLMDWNWASYAPRGYGATEFLLDIARHGHDICPWHDLLNVNMLAFFVGLYAGKSMERTLSQGSSLRQMQALSAATAYDILGHSSL